MDSGTKIVIFDGECMLCNKFIQYVIKNTTDDLILVSSISNYGKMICINYGIKHSTNLDTIFL